MIGIDTRDIRGKVCRASVLVLGLFLLLPGMASAETGSAWAELGFHANNPDDGPGIIVLSPIATGYYEVTDNFYGELTVGGSAVISLGTDPDLGEAQNLDAQAGNPYLGIGYIAELPGFELHFTGGLTIPLAVPQGLRVYTFAEGIRGRRDPWLWIPRRLSPVLGVRYTQEAAANTRIAFDASGAAMFWMGQGSQRTLFPFQIGAEGALVPTETFEIGVRALLVTGRPLSAAATSRIQTSAELFAQLNTERQSYQARFTVPLNEPYGFGVAPGGYWGLHVGAGMRF